MDGGLVLAPAAVGAHSEVCVCALPVWQLHVFCFQCQASA